MADPLTAALRDPARLESLLETALLDTRSEEAFDRLTRLACRTLPAPIALVALVEEDRQFFKSHVGLPEPFSSTRQTPLTHSFCKHVVLTREPLLIADAREHPEFRENPAVRELGVAAYAGIPLITVEGHVLGTFCAIDHEPRTWTADDVWLMQDLAAAVMSEIELRVVARQAVRAERARTALLESTGEGIYGIDAEGRCTFLNRAGTEMLGYSAEEALGRNMHALVHHTRADGEPYPYEQCPIYRTFRAGEGVRVAGEVLWRKDGTSFPADYSSFPIREEGEIRGAVVTFTDVTEWQRAEERAQRTGTQLEAVLRHVAEGVIFTDADGVILFVNEAARRIHGVAELGVPVGEYTTTYHLFTMEGEPYPPEELPLSRAVGRGETIIDAEWRIRRPDGTEVVAEGSAAPVLAADGTRLGAVLTFRDVTEHRAVQQERERLLLRERASRDRIAAILESITDAFFTLDADWRFTYVNGEAERVLQRPRDELLGRGIWSEFPDANDTGFYREYHRAVEERHTVQFEEFYPPLAAWFEVRAYPSEEGLSVYFRDVTERRRAEEERRRLLDREREARGEAERRATEQAALRRAAESLVQVFTIEEVIDEIARSATVAVEADAAFVANMVPARSEIEIVAATGGGVPSVGVRVPYAGSIAERVTERGRPEIIAPLSSASPSVFGELARSWPGGGAVVVPLVEAGEPIGALALVRGSDRDDFQPADVERASTFADLAALAFRKVRLLHDSEQKREQLQRVLESRGHLMRGFTHDLKNPLGAVDGHLQILEMGIKGELTPPQRESVERARASLQAGLDLIEDLVELARAESGRLEIQRQPVEVRDVARELAEDYRAAAEAKALRLQANLPEHVPAVESDATRVRQILGNLLSNAVKYTEEGDVTVTVAVAEDSRESWVTLEVSDTGLGMSQEELPLLFREFSRLGDGRQPGAGLGLAISQRIAHALGGRITVRSEPGRGSTFTLWLPTH